MAEGERDEAGGNEGAPKSKWGRAEESEGERTGRRKGGRKGGGRAEGGAYHRLGRFEIDDARSNGVDDGSERLAVLEGAGPRAGAASDGDTLLLGFSRGPFQEALDATGVLVGLRIHAIAALLRELVELDQGPRDGENNLLVALLKVDRTGI